jgi:hypothetical protein
MSFAVIGTAALWLTFVWLGSAIVASTFSNQKGFGEKPGLITGVVLSLLGAAVWAAWPAREVSRWRMHQGFSSAGKAALGVALAVVVVGGAIAVVSIEGSTTGKIGLVAVVVMVALIVLGLAKSISITQTAGGKTLAELRAERETAARQGAPEPTA